MTLFTDILIAITTAGVLVLLYGLKKTMIIERKILDVEQKILNLEEKIIRIEEHLEKLIEKKKPKT
jgi:hypothetical protein